MTPDACGIEVFDRLLVSEVHVRELTYDEIVQAGIALDDDSYTFFDFTIAFGTDSGQVDIGGQVQRVPVDRLALADLAETTEGYFYEAASVTELKQVYQDMGSSIGYRTVAKEIGRWFVGIGLLFAIAAAGLSLLWTSRLP